MIHKYIVFEPLLLHIDKLLNHAMFCMKLAFYYKNFVMTYHIFKILFFLKFSYDFILSDNSRNPSQEIAQLYTFSTCWERKPHSKNTDI